jgi:hypothetical protein
MKTFGLFILLFTIATIILSLVLVEWTSPQIVTHSTLLAYIMQQYFTEESKNK